jgi:Domain of unknown function (DUF4389)
MPYPVTVQIEPTIKNRNRMTTAFRIVLAIPHIILVGGVEVALSGRGTGESIGGHSGILGFVAFVLAIVSWFTIVFGGTHNVGARHYTTFYMRWRVRALSYLMLLQDLYPPFGDAPYPASIEVVDPATRNRLTVGFRIILAIPHFIALVFVLFAWWVTAVISWFAILLTGDYPEGLYNFGIGCLRWMLRVEAYVLLLVDEYPPFSLD